MLTGENGILTQAQRAKEETEQAQANEANVLSSYEDVIYEATTDVPQVNDSNPGVLEGSGKEQDPYTIYSIEDLVAFADSVTNGNTYQDQYVKLGLSLDFKSDKSYVDPNRENYYGYEGNLKEALTSGEGFKSIGKTYQDDSGENSFAGIFDGQNFKIMNLYISKDTTNTTFTIGLFNNNHGTIKNLELLESNINIKCKAFVGNIVGYNHNTIEGCTSSGNIILDFGGDSGRIGGICGCSKNNGIVRKCFNYTNLNMKNNGSNSEISEIYVGGISGNNVNASCCGNYGKIVVESNGSKGSYVGGIVGVPSAQPIQECFNKGIIEVKAAERVKVGGIIGYGTHAIVNNCYNTGEITADSEQKTNVGGIAGENSYNNSYKISNCYNIGKIDTNSSNSDMLGEIAGAINKTVVENCYYLETSGNNGVGFNNFGIDNSVSVSNIMSDEVLEKLNNNQSPAIWKKGNSYLELYWENV